MPCSARTCSDSSSIRAARRSPRLPWRWRPGSIQVENGEPLGYRPLPPLNIACTGVGPQASAEEWLRLAERSRPGKAGSSARREWKCWAASRFATAWRLHGSFPGADHRLTDRSERASGRLDYGGLRDVEALPGRRPHLRAERRRGPRARRGCGRHGQGRRASDSGIHAGCHQRALSGPGQTARDTQELLRKELLGRQSGSGDLLRRTLPGVLRAGGTAALVTPQNWLFLGTYKKLRARFLENVSWNVVARLGPRAFDTISGEVVNVALLALTRKPPSSEQTFAGLDASEGKSAADKAAALREKSVTLVTQKGQLGNPDARLTLKQIEQSDLLSDYAEAYWGQGTGDFLRFGRTFWETPSVGCDWSLMQSTVAETCEFSGREQIVFWEQGNGTLVRLAEQLRQIEGHSGIRPTRGAEAWGKAGVCVSLMRELPVTRYGGQIFDGNCAAVIPKDERHLPAIRAFCFSPVFRSAVRAIDQKMNVTNANVVKSPFRPRPLAKSCRREVPERPAQTLLERPDAMAIQRPSVGVGRAAAGGGGPAAGLSLAAAKRLELSRLPGPLPGRSGKLRRQGRDRLPPCACAANRPRRNGLLEVLKRPTAASGRMPCCHDC